MAYIWWNIAAAQGNADAEKHRDAVAAKLDAASLAEAQRLSKEHFARKGQPPRRKQEQHNQPFEAFSKDSLPDLAKQGGRKDKGKRTRTLPGGVNVNVLALDPTNPSTLYAGTFIIPGGGVFKSTDMGAHWTPINNGLTNP